ncbi:MAG: polymorphic toxin type 50 domain-containing protein, partial [bacterium]
WILTPDDRLCPVCASMSGKLADVKGKFDDPLGGKIEYPPLHPRCRCCCSLVESTGETNSTDAVGSGIIVSEINLQQFSAATDDIKRKIDSGELPLKLRQQKQDKHVLGTEKYKLALNNERLNDTGFKPSYMTIDNIQAFVTSKSGTGVLTMSKDGGIREKIESGAIVGKFWNQYTQEYEDTRCAIIVYSKTGTHVFPRREKR